MKKGKMLKQGDRIGVVAPASPKPEIVPQITEELESLGFRVKLGKSCEETYGGYLAGTPQVRAQDVNEMFADPEVDAIICLRGGYGSPQILPLLDYGCIAENPKLFVGYSDITALHTALGQRAGLATIHGPMASAGIAHTLDPLSRDYLLRCLMSAEPLGAIINPDGEELVCLVEGEAQGPIVGGNLSLISALMGTPYELDTRGKLLFLEDVGEEPYRVDRMLTQLALAGKLEDAAGFLIGTWTDCKSKVKHGFEVLDVIREIVVPFGKPTLWNLQAGHGFYNIAMPFGVQAYLHAKDGVLIIEESVARRE